MRRFGAFAAFVLALAACGSGQDPTIEGGLGPTTTSTTAVAVAGDTLPETGATATTAAAATGDGTAAGATPAAGEAGAADPASGEGGAPAPARFAPPAPGTYTFRTTGTVPSGGVLGGTRQVDEQTATTITAVSADTVRLVTTTPEGSQTTELRYEPTRVALLLLEVAFGGQAIRFTNPDGVTFAPVPPTAGQTWSGELRDDAGQLTASFSGATHPLEVITVMGRSVEANVIDATITITGTYSGFPVDATAAVRAWVDPALRTQVRSHQVTTTRQPFASTSDTTSELVAVTPG